MNYRIVIIEDNPFTRKAILESIDWKSLECTVVADLDDGVEAVKQIRELKPDIVISDIRLPGLSGLDIAKQTAEVYPDLNFIFITGFQDFCYAQSAVKLRAVDFILKPIKNEELIHAVEVATENIRKKQSREKLAEIILQQDKEMKEKETNAIALERKEFITNILNGIEYPDAQMEEKMYRLRLNFHQIELVLITPRDKKVAAFQMNSGHYCIRGIEFDGISVLRGRDAVCVLFFSENHYDSSLKEITTAFCEKAVLNSGRNRNDYCFSVTFPCSSIQELCQAYHKASEDARRNIFTNQKDWMLFCRKEPTPYVNPSVVSKIFEFSSFYANMHDQATLKQYVSELVDSIFAFCQNNTDLAKQYYAQICLEVAWNAGRYGNPLICSKCISKTCDIYKNIDEIEIIDDVKSYIFDFVSSILCLIESSGWNYSLLVNKILGFMVQNYDCDLTLEKIAQQFKIHPAYLSNLIKKETGKNFSKILLDIRMSKAKMMLQNPRFRVNEIGTAVGFKDYNYFYQVFKKYEHVSPKEYRQKMGKDCFY